MVEIKTMEDAENAIVDKSIVGEYQLVKNGKIAAIIAIDEIYHGCWYDDELGVGFTMYGALYPAAKGESCPESK